MEDIRDLKHWRRRAQRTTTGNKIYPYCATAHARLMSTRRPPFSSPEAAVLLVSTKNRDLWSGPKPGSPRFTDFPSLCAYSESSLTNLIGCGLNLLCLQSHSKTECRWTWPEVAILGADQRSAASGDKNGRPHEVQDVKTPSLPFWATVSV